MIGIIAAMPQEIREIERSVAVQEIVRVGNREFHLGSIAGSAVVLVLSRIGKVAAASTATVLLDKFDVSSVLLTGAAGAVHPEVQIGDVVVGDSFIQHDMDASASTLFRRFELPLLGVAAVPGCPELSTRAYEAAKRITARRYPSAKVHRGLIGSGDQFIADPARIAALRQDLPELLCIEMEGAAIAQVCFEFGKPFTAMRTISDKADAIAHVDFLSFIEELAAPFSHALVNEYMEADALRSSGAACSGMPGASHKGS